MAAVVFTTVGQAIGGPLGAAVGGVVGSTVDGSLFGRGATTSSGLQLQRSAYGEPISRLYGRSRQSGTLLWALPLQRSRSGKGSGRPAYVSSFAVGLSARPILDIGRVWADGREIRNSSGEFAAATKFRVYRGDGSAAVDPAIAAAEGIGNAPAYAGLAYVVFEDFALAEFGNRIPNLSFEVIADDEGSGPVHWLRDIVGQSGFTLQETGAEILAIGYSASENSWAADAQALSRVSAMTESYVDGKLSFRRIGRTHGIALEDLCVENDDGEGTAARRSIALGDRPGGVTLGYFDPDRDFQAGSQRAMRRTTGPTQSAQSSLTATAGMARTLVHRLLSEEEAAVSTLDIRLSWRWYGIAVGDRLQIEGQSEHWKVRRTEIRGMLLDVSCVLEPSVNAHVERVGTAGKSLASSLLVAAPTDIDAFELPMSIAGKGGNGFWVSCSGREGWRGAEIAWSAQEGDWTSLGTASEPVARGRLQSPLGGATSQLWDELSILEVELDRDDMWLESRSEPALLSGSNLLRVGGELLQFRNVEPLGNRRFRLTGLLRGRLGSGYAASPHSIGETIEKVDPERMQFQHLGSDRIGERIFVRALGIGEPEGGSVSELVISGAGAAPLAPCHVRAERRPGGDLLFSWKTRDRRMFEWSAEEISHTYGFLCSLSAYAETESRQIEQRVSSQTWLYSVAEQVRDFGDPLTDFSVAIASEGSGPGQLRSTGWVASAFLSC